MFNQQYTNPTNPSNPSQSPPFTALHRPIRIRQKILPPSPSKPQGTIVNPTKIPARSVRILSLTKWDNDKKNQGEASNRSTCMIGKKKEVEKKVEVDKDDISEELGVSHHPYLSRPGSSHTMNAQLYRPMQIPTLIQPPQTNKLHDFLNKNTIKPSSSFQQQCCPARYIPIFLNPSPSTTENIDNPKLKGIRHRVVRKKQEAKEEGKLRFRVKMEETLESTVVKGGSRQM